MKAYRIPWLVAAVLMLGACGKKETAEGPDEPASVAGIRTETPAEAPPVKPAPPVSVPALSPEERAAKLGFAGHLPQDIGVVMSFYQGNRTCNLLRASKLWQLADLPGAGYQAQPDPADGPEALFNKEFTIALGNPVGEQTGHLLSLYSRLSYFQMRGLVRALTEAARSRDAGMLESSIIRYSTDMKMQLMSDPESGIGLLEKLEMPPLYLAFRITPENRDAAVQQLAQMTEFLGMLGDMVEPVEVEKAGQTFAGYRISGAKVSQSLAVGREDMEQLYEPAMIDRLLAAISKRDLVMLSGAVDDYAILFVGSSADHLTFAPSSGESLAAGGTLAFCDAHAAKDLVAMTHARQDLITPMLKAGGGFSQMLSGLRDGFSESEGLGDTRDIQTLLSMVSDREAALRGLARTESGGLVAYLEDGLKIESYGGADSGAIDWGVSNRLTALGDSDNVLLFANMSGDAAYDEKAKALFEAFVETAYALAMRVSELPIDDPDMLRFKEMAGLFDKRFRPDAMVLWDALRGDASAALGAETALVVDLNGSVPPVPGFPQEVVDQAKFPRVSLVAPVEDRAKLASAWEGVDRGATGILARISEMKGMEIPMQVPMSSEKNGYTTWFFPMPFFTDDFVPSITIGDEWFAASTSKNQALDLLAKAGKGEARSGLWLTLNFQVLRVFVKDSLELLEKHPAVIPLADSDRQMMRDLMTATEDLEKITAHSRRENGVLRTSIHLKAR